MIAVLCFDECMERQVHQDLDIAILACHRDR